MNERNKEILRPSGDNSYDIYINVCKQAIQDENVFQSFKLNPNYTYELEHTPRQSAVNCLSYLKTYHIDKLRRLDWDLVRSNDTYVKTNRSSFKSELSDIIDSNNEDDFMFSPTTIYYLWAGFKIINALQEKKKNMFSFVEIGCGYGGQCLLIFIVAKLYNTEIKSYSLVDLFYANKLQEKYLNGINKSIDLELDKKCSFVKCLDIKDLKITFNDIDMVISNYCLSEISTEWAEIYMQNIIKKSASGFFLWNNKSTMGTIQPDHLSIEAFNSNDFPTVSIEPSLIDSHNNNHKQFCRVVTF